MRGIILSLNMQVRRVIGTESKALLRSKNTEQVSFPLSMDSRQSCEKDNRAEVVDFPAVKPHW